MNICRNCINFKLPYKYCEVCNIKHPEWGGLGIDAYYPKYALSFPTPPQAGELSRSEE